MSLKMCWVFYFVSAAYGGKTKSGLADFGKKKLTEYNKEIDYVDTKFTFDPSKDKALAKWVQSLADEILERSYSNCETEVQLHHCLATSLLIFRNWTPLIGGAHETTKSDKESLLETFFVQNKATIKQHLKYDVNDKPKTKFKVISTGVGVIRNGNREANSLGVCFVFWRPDNLMDQLSREGFPLGTTAMLLAFEYGLRKDTGMGLRGKQSVLHNLNLDNTVYNLGNADLRLQRNEYQFENHENDWLPLRRLNLDCMKKLHHKALFGYGRYEEIPAANPESACAKLIVYATYGVDASTVSMPYQEITEDFSAGNPTSDPTGAPNSASPISQVSGDDNIGPSKEKWRQGIEADE